MIAQNNDFMVEVLMILPDVEGKEKKITKKTRDHYQMFKKWNVDSITVYGPVPFNDPIYTNYFGEDYKGLAKKSPIIYTIKNMRGNDRVLYIENPPNALEKAVKLREIQDAEDILDYKEMDKNLGGNRAHIIYSGNGSGKAVISPILAKSNRNIYCSMNSNENKNSDDLYDLSSSVNVWDLPNKHEKHVLKRKQNKQFPQKWIGINNMINYEKLFLQP